MSERINRTQCAGGSALGAGRRVPAFEGTLDGNLPLVQDRHLIVEADGATPLSTRARRWIGNLAVAAAVGAVGLIGAPMLVHADNPAATAGTTTVVATATGGLTTAR